MLIEFFNTLYFNLLEEAGIKIKEINTLQKDRYQWLETYDRLPKDKLVTLFSTFDRSLPVRLILYIFKRMGEELAEHTLQDKNG